MRLSHPLKAAAMTSTPDAGGRTPGGDQRLESILGIATGLFFRKGYRGVSIRDLADAVGVKMSSLYYYFPSKEEILYRIIKRHIEGLQEATEAALASLDPKETGLGRLRVLVRNSVLYLLADRMAAGVSSTQARELGHEQQAELSELVNRYEARYLEIIREGITRGEFIATDPVIASYVILGSLVRLTAWYRPDGRLSMDEVADLYSVLLVRGLVVDPRRLAG
jgi:AcrR family transcriptional regulator